MGKKNDMTERKHGDCFRGAGLAVLSINGHLICTNALGTSSMSQSQLQFDGAVTDGRCGISFLSFPFELELLSNLRLSLIGVSFWRWVIQI